MIGTLLRGLGIVVLLVVPLAVLAWLGYQADLLGLALVAWATGCLFAFRTTRARRHQHGLLLLAAILVQSAAGLAIGWTVAEYASIAAWINVHWGAALAVVGLAVSPTAAGAVTFLNGIALAAWAFVKFLLLRALGRQSAIETSVGSQSSIAYRRREQAWRLKPWWLWARSLGWLLLVLGIGLTIWQAWNLRNPGFTGWVWLLPVLLVAVGVEWLQWLSGTVDEQAEPEFAAGNLGPDQLTAVFQDLWVRYRQVWPKHWRAAGNRSPEFPREG